MFEFDPVKSAINKDKHGIDFVEAQAIWLDDRRTQIPTSQADLTEERWVIVGRVGERLWAAVVTYREESIRIISVRRARDSEARNYGREDHG